MESTVRVDTAVKVTWVGLYLNIALSVFKFFAGFMGHSAAMIADAVHSFSDFVTDAVLLLGFRMVRKPVDKSHDYGHGKFETLTATIMGVSLIGVGISIFWAGFKKISGAFQGYALPQPSLIALYAAVVSIVVKEWLYRYTLRVGNSIHSQAVIANAWEHRSDALASVAAMLGIGGAIVLGERWHILDPLAAILVSFFIIKIAFSIFLGSVNELLEASLDEKLEEEILQIIKETPGAKRPHDMKTRKIGSNIAIDIHIEVDRKLNVVQAHDIATRVEHRLRASFGQETYISVHIEPEHEKDH